MLTLSLLRHAKSSWSNPSLPDEKRPLATRGVSDAPLMGRAMAERGIDPDVVLCSSARRTRDTLALVHRGERIVPAAQNKGGGQGDPFQVVNHFHISGPVDSRTQDQIAASAARATQRAMYRNL